MEQAPASVGSSIGPLFLESTTVETRDFVQAFYNNDSTWPITYVVLLKRRNRAAELRGLLREHHFALRLAGNAGFGVAVGTAVTALWKGVVIAFPQGGVSLRVVKAQRVIREVEMGRILKSLLRLYTIIERADLDLLGVWLEDLFWDDEEGELTLVEFGRLRYLRPYRPVKHLGPTHYLPPEEDLVGEAPKVFSLACLALDLVRDVRLGTVERQEGIFPSDGFTDDTAALLAQMLDPLPHNRPSFAVLARHPWLRGN